MNKNIKLAVAGAVLALSASAANAGIIIPAGDWTLDIGGNVNAYYTSTKVSGDFKDFLPQDDGAVLGGANASSRSREANITTGLLPSFLSVSGKTRQNDLDVAFTISINPGASTVAAGRQSSQQENRQAFLTFGDKSWGSIKLGKDLGIYASDAILNDMTLLGVGSGAGFLAGNTTTLGRIGTGFIYADWKAQAAYTTPNWNGLEATVGVTQAWNAIAANAVNEGTLMSDGSLQPAATYGTFNSAVSGQRGGNSPAFEGKASYTWTGDVSGKVWASAISQKVRGLVGANITGTDSETARGVDVGANINVAGFGLTGYYGDAKGMGTTLQLRDGFDSFGKRRDSKDYYVQGTYALPVKTKLGLSYGRSKLDGTSNDAFKEYQNSMWTVGAYHPLTKHLNLVAEYSDVKTEINNQTIIGTGDVDGKSKTVSLGAILFF
jgi:predicted porin